MAFLFSSIPSMVISRACNSFSGTVGLIIFLCGSEEFDHHACL